MDPREKLLLFLQQKGPSLPYAVSKEIGTNTVLASAYLSELKEKGKLAISHIKVGGSPLYYLPEHHAQLERFSDNLGEKQKKVYLLLQDKKILRDSELVPVFRAAIRDIKDFAVSFGVRDIQDTFWRWHALPKEDVEPLVKKMLGMEDKKPEPLKIKEEPVEKTEKVNAQSSTLSQEAKKEERSTVQKEAEKDLHPIESSPHQKPHVQKSSNTHTSAQSFQNENTQKEAQQKLEEGKPQYTNEFYQEVMQYFQDKGIEILEENVIRKASDIECIVKMPSPAGTLKYFVKAKSKKRISDGDLSSLYVQGQGKRLPVLLLTTGELTKKALELLEKELHGVKVAKLGR